MDVLTLHSSKNRQDRTRRSPAGKKKRKKSVLSVQSRKNKNNQKFIISSRRHIRAFLNASGTHPTTIRSVGSGGASHVACHARLSPCVGSKGHDGAVQAG